MSLAGQPIRLALNGRFGRKGREDLLFGREAAPAGSAGFGVFRMNFATGEFV
jgi:hypothetical protein